MSLFPIKTDTACLLKWAWSTIYLNTGYTHSCHRCNKSQIDVNNFEKFHNLPDKIHARQTMLNGEWPSAGCEQCQTVEQAGGESDRIFHLKEQKDLYLTPPELNIDATATSITPTILEVYFKNTCNMKCIYCGPHHSSSWNKEIREFGDIPGQKFTNIKKFPWRQNVSTEIYEQLKQQLWIYLNQHYLTLRRFHLLGGEPFLIEELQESLDFWETHPNPDLVFSIVTNLNIPHKLIIRYVDQMERMINNNAVWKFQITASIDCWGKEQEYIRYGLDLNLWRQNFEYLISKPWITPSINSAVSALSIKKLPELIKLINHWDIIRKTKEPILYSFNSVTSSPDQAQYFGKDVFEKDFDNILNLMPDNTETQKNIKKQIKSIKKKISKYNKNSQKIQELKDYLNLLDSRRGTNWRSTFPWLESL